MKIATVIGARPQFIKAAVLSRKLKEEKYSNIQEFIIHTGQHFDTNMSKIFFEELEIPTPYRNLGISGGSHAYQTGQMMVALEQTFEKLKPDAVLVYGDTNSTLAASLVAAKAAIPLIHIEAGLRSFRPGMPEEINRIVTDRLSQLMFCPNDEAVVQLSKEGFSKNVFNVGDIMYEGFLNYAKKDDYKNILSQQKLKEKNYIMMTLHREENTNDKERFKSLIDLANKISDLNPILFLVHPRTKKLLDTLSLSLSSNIKLIDPQPYKISVGLISNASLILTDSGGLQKEAYFAKTPCITMRDETEWTQTVETGWNTLIDVDHSKTLDAAQKYLTNFNTQQETLQIFGDGNCSIKILEIIKKYL